MDLNEIHKWKLFIVLINLLYVTGETYYPQNDEGPFVVCLDKGEPMRIANPFDPEELNTDTFIVFEWVKKEAIGSPSENASEVILMNFHEKGGKTSMHSGDSRIKKFEMMGLQINSVNYKDSGIYKATIMRTANSLIKEIHVVVASPPTLKSESLTLKVEDKEGSKVVSCGQVATLGTPAVQLALTAGNGSVLPTNYSDGFLTLQLASKTDTGEFFCGIDKSSPAKACIADADLERWDSSLLIARATTSAVDEGFGEITTISLDGLDSSLETRPATSSADTTGFIVAIAVVIVVLLIIVVILLIVVKRRKRRNQEKTYNTKSVEAQALESGIPLSHHSHSDDEGYDGEDPYNRSVSSAPYLSSKQSSASPYMVTGLKLNEGKGVNHYACTPANRQQSSNDRAPIYKEPPVVTPEEDDLTDSKPPVRKDRNRNVNSSSKNYQDNRKSWAGVVDSFKERQQQQQQQQQPQPVAMKRNKHFTRSSDGLNLVDRERGDLRGGGGEHEGTLV